MIQHCRMIAPLVTLLVVLGASALATEDVDWNETIPADVIRDDFAALYSSLEAAHVDLFAQRSRAAYDARYREMLSRFTDPMSRYDVQVAFQKFVAYGNVAHARIDFPVAAYQAFRDDGGRTFPIYPRIVDGTMYVGENYSGDARIRSGDAIVAINGVPAHVWLTRTAAHLSADTAYIAGSMLEFSFPMYVWAEIGEVAAFRLSLERDGAVRELTVAASARDAQRAAASALPETFVLDGNTRAFRMIDERIAYLRPGPFYNVENPSDPWDNAAFTAFVDRAFDTFIEAGARELIIDLRQNPGGNNSFSDAILAWIADEPFRFCSSFLVRSSDEAAASNAARLAQNPEAGNGISASFARAYSSVPHGETFEFDVPFVDPRDGERFDGRVYALINRHSYSNAVTVAAMIQDYGFGVVAGEKTSDMATTYGAMETFRLPGTGIEVGFPKAHIIRPSGDTAPDGVTPDWPLRSPVAAVTTDVVLDRLVTRIRNDED